MWEKVRFGLVALGCLRLDDGLCGRLLRDSTITLSRRRLARGNLVNLLLAVTTSTEQRLDLFYLNTAAHVY